MKKTLPLRMTLIALLCLTGCRAAPPADTSNLSFTDDFSLEPFAGTEIETFEMRIKPALSMQALYDRFDSAVEFWYPGKFTPAEKALYYDVNGTDRSGNPLPRTEKDENGVPTIGGFARSKEALLRGDYDTPWLWLNSDRGMIQMYPNGALQSVTCDAAYKLDHPDGSSVGMYCAADENTVIARIHIPPGGYEGDAEYHLLDGDVKLRDAIAKTQQLLQDSDRGIADEKLIADITDAWVVDMGGGIYGYHFWLTSAYSGIRLDTCPMKNGLVAHNDTTNCGHSYDLYPGYAFMIESDRLDSVMTFGYKRAYSVEKVKRKSGVISFEDAKAYLSQAITAGSNIVISRAEFVYTPYSDPGLGMAEDGRLSVDAAWRFTAKNENDGYDYVFYVDALTGEVEYYKYW